MQSVHLRAVCPPCARRSGCARRAAATVRAAADAPLMPEEALHTRRATLSLAASVAAFVVRPAVADDGAPNALCVPLQRRFLLLLIYIIFCCILSPWAADWATFYGAANPPATYGGTGGTTRKLARYSFAVPPSFTEDAVSKVDKGASGIDTRFLSAGRKKSSITVITLRNEGSRDGGGFVLKDADSALRTVAGANYALQDAIGSGAVTSRPRPGGFAYEIEASPTSYAIGIETSSVSKKMQKEPCFGGSPVLRRPVC